MRIDIIGRGKVGRALEEAFLGAGLSETRLVESRSLDGLRRDAGFWVIAVADNAIREVALHLHDIVSEEEGPVPVVAHTSGATPMEILSMFARYGVFYPLQTFSPGVKVDFQKVPLLVDGSDESVRKMLADLGAKVSRRVMYCSDRQRVRLHLAAVFACNFTNEMLAIASSILAGAALPEDILNPLIEQTLSKALSKGAANVRTGPAIRGDFPTIERHLSLLEPDSAPKKIYEAVTEAILNARE